MRGGTSKGPYFKLDDLPADRETRDRFLLAAMGSPDVRQIDGLGGADTLTSKVAIVSKSNRPGVDVDYHFAQVDINRPLVDTNPSCGNMLAGVGPFAIEKGFVEANDGRTRVVIFDVNTGAKIEAEIETPGGIVNYEGSQHIDGVPGTAAPVILTFLDIVGAKTGAMFPTGKAMEKIDGVDVSLVDVCMPMMLLRAADVGLTGYEGRSEIDGNKEMLARVEALRLEAGRRMGFGDVSEKVIPKVGLLAPPREHGVISSRYLTPHALHAAHAITGACCVSTACAVEGTVAFELAKMPPENPCTVWIEHPSGMVDVRFEYEGKGTQMKVRVGVVRTARPIMRGRCWCRPVCSSRRADFERRRNRPLSPDFLLTSLVVILLPGTGVIYTLTWGLGQGWRASIWAALGCTLGIVPHMAASIVGLAALLHASTLAFQAIRILGVAYLLYMAWLVLRDSGPLQVPEERGAAATGRIVGNAVSHQHPHPKLSAVLPGVPAPASSPATTARPAIAMLGLAAVFMLMTFVVFVGYGACAAAARAYIMSKPGAMMWMRRAFAGAFFLLGLRLALTSH